MLIQCPECNFSRTLDESKVPPTAQVATCPRCKHRFRFRNLEDETAPGHTPGGGPGAVQGSRDDQGFSQDQPGAGPERPQGDERKNSGTPDNRAGDDGHSGARDLWDHIASLGEKWEQQKPRRPRMPGDPAGPDYQASSGANGGEPEGRAGVVPWEHPEKFGLVGSFLHTLLRVLMRGKLFFSAMPTSNRIGKPLVFYFLVIALHFLISFMWIKLYSMNSEVAANLEQFNAAISQINLIQFLALIFLNAALTITMLAMLFSLLFRLSGVKNATFRRNLRILCYASSGLVLVIVPIIGPIMSCLFAVFSSIQGFAYSYNIPLPRAALLVVPVYLLLLMVVLSTSVSAM